MYKPGETIKLPTLARTLKRMVEAERAAKAQGPRRRHRRRARSLLQGRHRRARWWRSSRSTARRSTRSDFAEYFARIEEPAKTTYRGYTVYKHGFGSQGPVLLQALNILENFDLQAMGYDSADYLHTVIEALKLAYADRDTYYADPAFVQVPGEGLLSKAYAKERAALIDPKHASKSFIAGDPLKYDSKVKEWPYWKANIADGTRRRATRSGRRRARFAGVVKDTTHMAVIDKDGNIFDVTPSGGWIRGAVILGDTGIGMSVRGEQFWLDKTRANQIRPRARPRYTLTPSIVFKGDMPLMALGTPGGDNQDQTILQAFLNIVEFWDDWYPNLHAALEWPRVQTLHFYGSFWPHTAGFNKLNVEATIPDAVFNELKARGHDVSRLRPFGMSGCATAVMIDPATRQSHRRRRSAPRLLRDGVLRCVQCVKCVGCTRARYAPAHPDRVRDRRERERAELERRHHQRRQPLRRADRFHVPRRQHRQHALVEAQVADRIAGSGRSRPTTARRASGRSARCVRGSTSARTRTARSPGRAPCP